MAGKLTVCPTPIGNLEDLSARARRALEEADIVACEDTRRAGRLYERLEISRPRLVSYHDQNEAERAPRLAQQIVAGSRVTLISDAGTPAISDPGFRLIRACLDRDLEVEVLPGPSAVTTALVASGLPTDRWRFEGFLPRRAGELERLLGSAETVVAFESPRRLPDSLAALAALAPDRQAAVCRELTKLHEEVSRGPLGELARRYRDDVRGEIVVVIAPAKKAAAGGAELAFAADALRRLVQSGARPRAAASVVAALTGLRANDLYRELTGREPRSSPVVRERLGLRRIGGVGEGSRRSRRPRTCEPAGGRERLATRDAAADEPRFAVPGARDAPPVRARRRRGHPRPEHRARAGSSSSPTSSAWSRSACRSCRRFAGAWRRCRWASTTTTGSTTPTSTSTSTSASWHWRRRGTAASWPSRWRGSSPARSTARGRSGSCI